MKFCPRAAALYSVLISFALVSASADAFLRSVPVPSESGDQATSTGSTEAPQDHAPPGEYDSYDRANPDFRSLQRAPDALRGMPLDQNGSVDWVKALREGAIRPREVLSGSETFLPLDLDVIMRNTKAMPFVRFPHKAHTEWLACKNCHPGIFQEKAGSTAIRMEDIFRGRFCGTCHDRVAFITHRSCFRCHSVPQTPGAAGP